MLSAVALTTVTDEELVAALRAADAVRFGEFELSHGGTSDYYVDKYRFETDPAALELIAERFAALLDDDATLGGVALGGVPLAAATSVVAGVPYVVVRKQQKEYGTANLIEGDLEDGRRVTVVEDIITTGQSAVDAVEALRAAGAVVERALIVVDREEGGREALVEAGVSVEALVTASELLDERE